MDSPSLCTLPHELLNIIGQETAAEVLHSLLLTSKNINDALTPLLYASISLYDYKTARKCTNTLAKEPQEHYAQRDLAAYVRSFTVRFDEFGLKQGRRARFARSLEGALSRMSGLQHIAFDCVYFGTPKVFIALGNGASRTLRSFSFKPDRPAWWPDGSEADALDSFRPTFPELEAVALTLPSYVPPAWRASFQHVLDSRGSHLRRLVIGDENAPSVGPLFPSPGAWSALQELVLTVGTTPQAFAGFPPGLNVRKLTLETSLGIPQSHSADDIVVLDPIPAYLFPNLEYLACAYQLLPAFLPAGAPTQRPLRTVHLNKAYYDPNGGAHDSYMQSRNVPEWLNVRKVLECLSRSAGPVVDLAFHIDWFDAKTLPVELVDYIQSIERLVIVLSMEPGNTAHISNYGKLLFAHTPKLRAFYLSDAPIKDWLGSERSFLFAFDWDRHKAWLEEWGNHTTTLEEVAFSTKCSWKRTDQGWVLHAYKKDDESDDEDEDEDNDENSEDNEDGANDNGDDVNGRDNDGGDGAIVDDESNSGDNEDDLEDSEDSGASLPKRRDVTRISA
ncbi:hypothetical protein C8Q73DRAFT_791340 [Cubamyces lactineus]|nr:hypothetical protein C8Q73DRAFT_791340 [Cubamyces lactineus]